LVIYLKVVEVISNLFVSNLGLVWFILELMQTSLCK